MPYSIGSSGMEVIKPDFGSSLNALSDAYKNMQQAGNALATMPLLGREMIQDNADARYTADLNRFSNDPEGLAKALANGQIDMSNVRAETLGKTQQQMKDITASKIANYQQGQLEDRDQYFKDHQDDLLKYRGYVMSGDVKNGQALINSLKGTLPNYLAYQMYEGDPFANYAKQQELALEKQRNAIAGGSLAYQKQQDARAQEINTLLTECEGILGSNANILTDKDFPFIARLLTTNNQQDIDAIFNDANNSKYLRLKNLAPRLQRLKFLGVDPTVPFGLTALRTAGDFVQHKGLGNSAVMQPSTSNFRFASWGDPNK